MSNPVRAIPEGYHTVTPYLTCKNSAKAIDFYKSVFGATEITRMTGPDGKVGHAELKIGDSLIFLADEFPVIPVERSAEQQAFIHEDEPGSCKARIIVRNVRRATDTPLPDKLPGITPRWESLM